MAQLIVNRHGWLHEIPDDWRIPHSSREATKAEKAHFEKTGDPIAANANAKAVSSKDSKAE